MAVFRAFKPTAMNKIAQAMGYSGDMSQFQNFIEQDPARQARMKMFEDAAMQMAKGGVVRMQTGGLTQKGGQSFNFTYDQARAAQSNKQLLVQHLHVALTLILHL